MERQCGSRNHFHAINTNFEQSLDKDNTQETVVEFTQKELDY